MRKTSIDRIIDLYGSAYLTPFNLDNGSRRLANPEFEAIPVPDRPAGRNHLAWTAAAMVAIIGLTAGAGYLGS